MIKEKVLSSLEEIKVISDPFRLKILFLFDEETIPLTVKQMAVKLGEVASKVHYHVKELERIGVLEIVETREKAGILEKFYLNTAEIFRVERNINGTEAEQEEHLLVGANMFQTIQQDFLKSNRLKGPEDKGSLHYGLYYLTPEERKELDNHILEFLKDKNPREGALPYRFAYTLFRKFQDKEEQDHGIEDRD